MEHSTAAACGAAHAESKASPRPMTLQILMPNLRANVASRPSVSHGKRRGARPSCDQQGVSLARAGCI